MRIVLFVACLAGCGGAAVEAPRPAPPPPPVRTAAENPGFRAMATDSLISDLCPRVIDRFVGLPGWPGEEGLQGAEAGRATAAGRWWIRECRTALDGERLKITLGGPGWSFLDRQESGFRIQQYVFFDATATLTGEVDVAYDRDAQLLTVWLTPDPTQGVDAQVSATGNVGATASSGLTNVVDTLSLGAATTYASDTAREQVAAIGAAQMRERLAQGMTITTDVRTHQTDFLLGALPRGERPRRPFILDDGGTWLSNERGGVWPGGLEVLGPFAPMARALVVTAEVETGAGVLVQPICANELRSALATALTPGIAGSVRPAIQSQTIYRVDAGGVANLDLGREECDRYLAVTSLPGAPDPARARFLVREAGVAATAPGGNVVVAALLPATPTGMPATPMPATATVANGDSPPGAAAVVPDSGYLRVSIRAVRIAERRPDGDAWDTLNGPVPDPYVVVYRGSVLAGRTAVVEDRYAATLGMPLEEAVPRRADAALRFDVIDEDAAFDDPIGSARITGAQLPARAGEVTLPLFLPGEARRPSGTLVLWVEPDRRP